MSRKLALKLAAVSLAMASFGSAMAGPALSWNLSNEIRLNTAGANGPAANPDGVWSYRYYPAAQIHTGYPNYMLLPYLDTSCDSATLRCWRDLANTLPLVGVDDITEILNSTAHEDAGVPVMHPTPTDAAIVGWKSPISGRINVLGRFSDVDWACSGFDGVDWYVDRDNVTMMSGHVQSTGSNARQGNVFSQTLTVRKDQSLFFIVTAGPNQNHMCDSTQLDVLITAQQ